MRRMEGKEHALERAKEFLESAEACWQADGLVGCALCCYTAMFWAAIAALMHVGVKAKKWKHDDVKRLFGLELIKKRHLTPEKFGEWLKDAYELRNDAHYGLQELSQKEVERTVRHAREFVAIINEVIKGGS